MRSFIHSKWAAVPAVRLHERFLEACPSERSSANLARYSLSAEGDDGLDSSGAACGQIAGRERYEEEQKGDRGDGWEIAWGKPEQHAGD
jgi:hypothetical protein